MTAHQPTSGPPRRPPGTRNPGDDWVVAPTGERYWGRFGAAGLLAIDPARGVLLQHRVSWSHFGGTWALPGGARHEGESAGDAAVREAREEAGVPAVDIRARFMSVLDLGYWSYATVVADVTHPFEPVISDPESVELKWVPVDEVDAYPLHPGFETAWRRLRPLVDVRPAVVVDAANVVGSVPDGWWRDRAGAAARLIGRIDGLASTGLAASVLDLAEDLWFPEWSVVIEGAARETDAAADRIGIVRAPGAGDDAIAAEAHRLVSSGRAVDVVTSDRDLAARVTDAGARVRGARWLTDMLGD